MKYYAGIGSRSTPLDVQRDMRAIASRLETLGYTLRSGGAIGADQAFEGGVGNVSGKEIFRPEDATPEALALASKFHPAWERCSDYIKKLHARNGQILLGRNLDTPVDFVICWTQGGTITGGTGQALRIAKSPEYEIPIWNLGYSQFQKLAGIVEFLKKLENQRT